MDAFREFISVASVFVLPAMIVGIPLYGLFKRVPVYESFVEGGKEGFQVAVRIIPFIVAILFAIGMFRASGAMEWLASALSPVLALIGMPAEVLPMAIVRPLTGSGSVAIVADLAEQYGTDALVTRMASTMFGSTETTFYVIAVYFGAVGVSKTRHAVPAGLAADIAAMLLAVWFCLLFFG
jgi:spore maturation protein B